MKPIHWITLIILASISGSSFLFTKSLANDIGPMATTVLRIFIAGLALVVYSFIVKSTMDWAENWKQYAIIGVINSGIPFLLYSYAALYMPASYMAIVNSSAPIFGAIFSVIWLSEKLTITKVFGLSMGMLGVGLVTYSGSSQDFSNMLIVGFAACILAAASYAISGIYIKKRAKGIKPLALAGGSQFVAGLIMIPFCYVDADVLLNANFGMSTIVNILVLSIVCSAIAYILYFRLMFAIGPTKTLTVTFLSPFFAMVLGYIIFDENITLLILLGCVIIITSTIIINGTWKPKLSTVASDNTKAVS
jgi:drug/metabolite transporter (DMT)-like permease